MKQDYICAGALTEDALTGAVSDFLYRVRPHRERLWDYYEGQQPVPKGEAVRGRPNNLLRVPFPRYITEVQTGYFLGVPPTLSYERPEEGRIYADLPMDHLLFDIGRDMSICGEGFALVWLEQSGVRVCRCDPLTCFGIRGGEAGEPLRAAVRLFKRPDDSVCGMLYEEERVTPFTWDGQRVALGAPEENLPGHLALVPFNNNCQTCGDFEMVTGLMDAYNLLLSGAMDDMQSVANAFLALYGMQGTTQGDIDEANRTRILSLAEGGRHHRCGGGQTTLYVLRQRRLIRRAEFLRPAVRVAVVAPRQQRREGLGHAAPLQGGSGPFHLLPAELFRPQSFQFLLFFFVHITPPSPWFPRPCAAAPPPRPSPTAAVPEWCAWTAGERGTAAYPPAPCDPAADSCKT